MSGVNFYLPIAKVDREQRMVFGYASTPTRDLDGEVIELDAIKDALPDYMQWRNIREMHKPSAVGVAQEANVDEKGLYIGAKIVDDDAWKKVSEEVYKGFSIGGDVTDRKGSTITGLKLIEISLVDRPANPDCRIDVIKAAAVLTGHPANAFAGTPTPTERGNLHMDADDVTQTSNEFAEAADSEERAAGLLARIIAKLAGSRVVKGGDEPGNGKKPYGDVEYADPGYRAGKKRYPIDTEEHIRAAWSYIHHEKNGDEYTPEQLASIKRRIVAAWKKEIDEKGPPEAKMAEGGEEKRDAQPEGGHGGKPVANDDPPVRSRSGFASGEAGRPAKSADAGERAEAAAMDRAAEISAEVMRKMADVEKRAASGAHAEHVRKAAHHLGEAHKCCAAGMECVAKAMKARKAAEGGEGDGQSGADHMAEAHEHLAMAGHHHVLAMHHLGKAAGRHEGLSARSRSGFASAEAGERGEGPGDAEGGIYRPEGGLDSLDQRQLTEGNVPDYSVDRPYPGKAAKSRQDGGDTGRETISKREHEALLKAARLEGELEALKKLPASPKARLFSVPRGSLPVAEADEPSAMEKLFKGVNVEATDPAERQAAARKMITNMITGGFGRPVISDPTFRGGAAR